MTLRIAVILILMCVWCTPPTFAQETTLISHFLQSTPIDDFGYREISYEQLLALKMSGEDFFFFDAMSHTYYTYDHIPGAESLPFTEVHFKRMDLLAHTYRPIVVYAFGFTTRQRTIAACMLKGFGYKRILMYTGGLLDWNQRQEQFSQR